MAKRELKDSLNLFIEVLLNSEQSFEELLFGALPNIIHKAQEEAKAELIQLTFAGLRESSMKDELSSAYLPGDMDLRPFLTQNWTTTMVGQALEDREEDEIPGILIGLACLAEKIEAEIEVGEEKPSRKPRAKRKTKAKAKRKTKAKAKKKTEAKADNARSKSTRALMTKFVGGRLTYNKAKQAVAEAGTAQELVEKLNKKYDASLTKSGIDNLIYVLRLGGQRGSGTKKTKAKAKRKTKTKVKLKAKTGTRGTVLSAKMEKCAKAYQKTFPGPKNESFPRALARSFKENTTLGEWKAALKKTRVQANVVDPDFYQWQKHIAVRPLLKQ